MLLLSHNFTSISYALWKPDTVYQLQMSLLVNNEKIPTTDDTTEAEEDVPELYHQRTGEIARCWIKYSLTLIQKCAVFNPGQHRGA